MLPAPYRLRLKADFQHVYRSGKTLRTAYFRISTHANPQSVPSRLGIVVPNKIIKKAVARNRKKRQIRAALEDLLSELPEGYDIVLNAQPGCALAEQEELREDIRKGLAKIGYIQQKKSHP